ncbi:hypothetical protein ACIBQ6_44095 [Nonomuraea sp. NPDC049655]
MVTTSADLIFGRRRDDGDNYAIAPAEHRRQQQVLALLHHDPNRP